MRLLWILDTNYDFRRPGIGFIFGAMFGILAETAAAAVVFVRFEDVRPKQCGDLIFGAVVKEGFRFNLRPNARTEVCKRSAVKASKLNRPLLPSKLLPSRTRLENREQFRKLLSIGSESTSFTIKNNCPWTIWPAALTSANSPQLGTSGFALGQGASTTINAPARWEGRFWARTFCGTNGGRFTCPIGDCGSGQVPCNGNGGAPPVSLAEFRLNGDGNKDFYDISLVDGFNLPVTIAPQTGGCPTTSCPRDVNAVCPSELSIRASNGGTIGCKSACLAFNSDNYCCRGSFNTPQTCPPTNYSKFFKSQCPQAYSYAYDDGSSTFTCPSGGNYVITFCP